MTTTGKEAADGKRCEEEEDQISLAPFNPTCHQAQMTALKMLKLKSDDVLFDLGSGDGQLLIKAATQTHGVRCVGIELDPKFVSRGNQVKDGLPADIKSRVLLRQGDVLVEAIACRSQLDSSDSDQGESSLDPNDATTLDRVTLLDDATAVFIYLLPKGMKKVKPLLDAVVVRRRQEQRPFRVVSYVFCIPGWEPKIVDRSTKAEVKLYLYDFSPENPERNV